jgi:hypothetical protein
MPVKRDEASGCFENGREDHVRQAPDAARL